jgi:hypothetical protein
VERRHCGRINLGTHIAARDRIGVTLHHAPLAQRAGVDLVERPKSILGERGGRAQLAGAECRQRLPCGADRLLDARKALGEGD